MDTLDADINAIKANFPLLERAVAQFDARFSLRALRSISSLRKRLTSDALAQAIVQAYVERTPAAARMLAAIGQLQNTYGKEGEGQLSEMEIDSEPRAPPPPAAPANPAVTSSSKNGSAKEILPEVEIYLAILAQVYLFDQKAYEAGAAFSSEVVQKIHWWNRRTLDSLSARVYFYYSLFYEHLDPPPPSPLAPVIGIRQQLLAALRTSVLRKDPDTQATVTTLLLRNYLSTINSSTTISSLVDA